MTTCTKPHTDHDLEPDNPFERVCREWLKGCSVADPALGGHGDPAECPDCTAALLSAIKGLGVEVR